MEITVNNYLWHNGKRLDVFDFEISQDWDTYLWTGQVQIANAADYKILQIGDAVTLYLQGAPYQLVIDGRSHQDSDGNATFVVQVASPSIALGKNKITRTWNAVTARNVCEELAGSTMEWNIINWTIPSGRLSVVGKTPIEIMRMVVNAAGGVIQTRPDGTLKAQYKTPVAFNKIDSALPSAIYTDRTHIISYSESYPKNEFFNAAIITDEEESDRRYYAEYIKTDHFHGTLRIYSEPWFENFQVSHTGHQSVKIEVGAIKYLEHIETIEFKQSQANVKQPIFSLQKIEWQSNNLGTVRWDNRTLSLNNNNQYGVAIVHYTSRCFEFKISHLLNEPQLTQFIILE